MRKLLAVLLLAPCLALAQAYPSKPVKLIVPFPAGGTTDLIARLIQAKFQENLGQPLVIENKGGAGGSIGAAEAAKAPPDGYTLLMVFDTHAVNHHLYKQAPDPFKTLEHVCLMVTSPSSLVVVTSFAPNNMRDLVAHAKANPGALNFGSSGIGSPQFLGGTLLQQMTGTRMNHVPYKGAAPAVTDLLAGRIQIWVGAANSLLPHIRADKLRVLGTSAGQRFSVLPETPTIAEAGLPGYDMYPWLGMFVPAKTPPEVVAKINAEISRILNSAEVKAKLVPQGMDIATGSPEQLARIIRDDDARWGKVIRDAGVKPE